MMKVMVAMALGIVLAVEGGSSGDGTRVGGGTAQLGGHDADGGVAHRLIAKGVIGVRRAEGTESSGGLVGTMLANGVIGVRTSADDGPNIGVNRGADGGAV